MKPSETNCKIHPNFGFASDAIIGEFVIIGEPARDKEPGGVETLIGVRAVIRSHTVIYAGNVIGYDFETGHGFQGIINES
ncbi:MAG: hypothetical protein ABI874_07115 [Chloroflexota bacterium]